MLIRSGLKKFIILAACLVLTLTSALPVLADTSASDTSLTLTGFPADTTMYAYKIADYVDGQFVLVPACQEAVDSGVAGLEGLAQLNEMGQTAKTSEAAYASWGSKLANSLIGWDGLSSLEKLTQKFTGGEAVFDLNGDMGAYVITGDPVAYNYQTWYVSPSLISVPGEQDGSPLFNVTAAVKPYSIPITDRYRVEKVWCDANGKPLDEKNVPDKIEVKITKTMPDGSTSEYKTVTLNADNNWQYEWEVNQDGGTYAADEVSVPTNFKMAKVQVYDTDKEMNITTVTNTYVPPTPTPTPKATPTPTPPKTAKNVQTGDTNKPMKWVIVTAIAAACLVVIFVVGRKNKK